MIMGVGTDLVSIERMQRLWSRHGQRALERILTDREQALAVAHRNPVRFLAMRFAGKEAVAKALGTGFRGVVSLQALSILPDGFGKPTVLFSDDLRQELERRQITGVEISLADASGLALAFAVAWSGSRGDSGHFGSNG
ncbi:MAG: holo-ACP synthase [Gammaproteobacteria bacterium]